MKKTVGLLAVAGLAGTATANSWIIDRPDEVQVGEPFSIMLTIDYDPDVVAEDESGVQGLSAGIFDVLMKDSSTSDYTIDSWTIDEDLIFLTGDLTSSDGQNTFNTNIGQLTLFGPFTKDDPLKVMTINITAGGVGTIDLETSTNVFEVWMGTFDTAESVPADIADAMTSINVVPTPASAALLGLGGLVAMRRRR